MGTDFEFDGSCPLRIERQFRTQNRCESVKIGSRDFFAIFAFSAETPERPRQNNEINVSSTGRR
jgi:hypothetical protein